MDNEAVKPQNRWLATLVCCLAFLLLSPVLFAGSAQASFGYERGYPNSNSDFGEVYVEYPASIYYNGEGGTGVTKFPIEYSVRQNSFWGLWGLRPITDLRWEVPDWWMVEVYVDDRSGYWDDTLSLMRFYPQQAVDLGTSLEWSFDASAGNEIGQIGVSVTASGDPSTFSYDYVKNPTRGWNAPGEYVKLGHLFVEYNQGAQWGGATSNGAIVLAVRDDYAHDYSYGHLIYIKLVFTLVWESGTDFIHDYEVKKTVEFILGDDIDPATDSNLYLRPGYTDGS